MELAKPILTGDGKPIVVGKSYYYLFIGFWMFDLKAFKSHVRGDMHLCYVDRLSQEWVEYTRLGNRGSCQPKELYSTKKALRQGMVKVLKETMTLHRRETKAKIAKMKTFLALLDGK